MAVERPLLPQLEEINSTLRLGLSDADLREFQSLVSESLEVLDWVDERMVSATPEREPTGHPPAPEDNRLGAWYWKTKIASTHTGPLAGKTVAVKDNICVAGVPMMNGSAVLEGYVPEQDATVVRRVLEAGAVVAGKAVCESFCFSGASHTSDTGPVRNPYDLDRSSGGSSSGCAALLAARQVDLALGSDQGGSIRAPSSWSGVYGLKPTVGLVPYTGAFPLEMTLDHLGPMATSTSDVALLLDVIAGPDGLDPRQNSVAMSQMPESFHDAIELGVEGFRIGMLGEGFGLSGVSEPDVDQAVRSAAEGFVTLGAELSEISVPWHETSGNLALAIAAEGSLAVLIHGSGVGTGWRGFYPIDLVRAYRRGMQDRVKLLPAMVKLQALVGQWLHDRYGGLYYAAAQNLSRELAAAYDQALSEVDLLVMPTTPLKATPLPEGALSAGESIHLSHQMGANTSPFNVSGHPAMNVPCALSEGLPVGMMIVGRRGEDDRVLRAAHAFEMSVYRLPPPRI